MSLVPANKCHVCLAADRTAFLLCALFPAVSSWIVGVDCTDKPNCSHPRPPWKTCVTCVADRPSRFPLLYPSRDRAFHSPLHSSCCDFLSPFLPRATNGLFPLSSKVQDLLVEISALP
ncbi:hypothetical protein B0T21DRAFT_9046 [Apiosordaria backusii]|uniref:Secreted protein n=1 Tax=Apiosordaria backusii TaxID=314023 RepID=A0AA40K6H3_9PEZI|nr:hypothetical protein B0T21DRAFT_9046 [Apiosordaria backusii]